MESMYGCIHYESVSHLSCHVPKSFVTNMRLLSTLAATEEGRQLATCSSHDLGCSSWSDLLQLSDQRMPETCFIFGDARNLWNMQLHAWLTLLMVHVGSCMYHKHFMEHTGIKLQWVCVCVFPISSRRFSSIFCWLGIPYNLAFDDVCRPSQERCSMATCTVVTGPVERQPFPRKCHCLHFSVLFAKAEQKVFERDVNRKPMVWGVWIISHNKKIRLSLNLAFWVGL